MPYSCRDAACHVGGLCEIVGGAGRHLAEHQPLRGAAGEQDDDLVAQLVFGQQIRSSVGRWIV